MSFAKWGENPEEKENEEKKAGEERCANKDARSNDAVRVSAKDGQPYAEILEAIKTRVNPSDAGLEVLSIRKTRKNMILIVLKTGDNVSAFEKTLDQVVGEKATV